MRAEEDERDRSCPTEIAETPARVLCKSYAKLPRYLAGYITAISTHECPDLGDLWSSQFGSPVRNMSG